MELVQDPNNLFFDWLKIHIQLLISISLFNTCIETGTKILCQGSWKSYTTINDPVRHKRINNLLKICYLACTKLNSDFEVSEDMFTDMMKNWPWDIFRFENKECILWLFKYYLPELPEEIPLLIFKTKLSEVEKIPPKLPDKINDEDLVKYMLNMIQLIMEQKLDYESLGYDLLLKHFFNHDILIGVDSQEEHYFVKKNNLEP